MKLAIIVAAAQNGVIGRNNQLPWHLPQDLKYFKAVTFGKPVIMGRKTYESIGRPLPGRTNIVITRDSQWSAADGVIVVNSIENALKEAQKILMNASPGIDEAIIIGGAEIYRSTLKMVDKVYLTRIGRDFEGDAWFPALPENEWLLDSVVPGDLAADMPHEFLVYKRNTEINF
ncbi:MAG TPA: dihydrofolate reductase [Cellvibrio sp.]|nr:dihydrofolate reductase [Cellvibrio sp.]